jgi:sRNA-binding carbon storage regulator CsrA
MLSLSRKIGQAIAIDTSDGVILVYLKRMKGKRATLGIEAPQRMPITRVDNPRGRTEAAPAS